MGHSMDCGYVSIMAVASQFDDSWALRFHWLQSFHNKIDTQMRITIILIFNKENSLLEAKSVARPVDVKIILLSTLIIIIIVC